MPGSSGFAMPSNAFGPKPGSVNQIEPSDLQTTSLGAFSRLAFVAVDQHGDGAVKLGAGDPTGQVLAGEEPALPVARVAVGVVATAGGRC